MDTDEQPARPTPVPDERTSAFWDAARHHELRFQRCQHCGHFAHPPVDLCTSCQRLDAPQFRFEPVSGLGRVVNWTVVHDQMVSGFAGAAPIVHVLVALDAQEGLRYPATLVGDAAGLALGAPVEVVFVDQSDATLPCFRLISATGNRG